MVQTAMTLCCVASLSDAAVELLVIKLNLFS